MSEQKQTEKKKVPVRLPVLSRVEGEGALEFSLNKGQIEELKLRIFEPPRYFEKFLQGRHYTEVPDIVARICGICPVAYQMTAVQALESLLVPDMPEDFSIWLNSMRQVLYCGEWIQSHALHIHLLAAPDLFGFNSAIEMAQKYPDIVRRGIRLQGLGNDIISLLGARSVHPVGVRVGGFYKAPEYEAVSTLLDKLKALKQEAYELVVWLDSLELPHPHSSHISSQKFVSVSLQNNSNYTIYQGQIVSDQGLNINSKQYPQYFSEYQAPQSTAFHAHLEGQPYLVGPLARLNNNTAFLNKEVQQLTAKLSIQFPNTNMFNSIIARGIEIYSCIITAIDLLENYTRPEQAWQEVTLCSGECYGATEAPRGLLWHYYQLDKEGYILKANIIPPTSQNQARIEADLQTTLQKYIQENPSDYTEENVRQLGEMVIRNYDPCISCATHFLKLKIHA